MTSVPLYDFTYVLKNKKYLKWLNCGTEKLNEINLNDTGQLVER